MDRDTLAMVQPVGAGAGDGNTASRPGQIQRAEPAADGRAGERPQLELIELSKRFGPAVSAVEHLSLALHKGEFVSLLGPSGCGKTTTLRMIAGFEAPTQGEIYCDGRLLNRMPPHRRPVNTVFQNYALFPHMRVFDNVAYGLRARRAPARGCASRGCASWVEPAAVP